MLHSMIVDLSVGHLSDPHITISREGKWIRYQAETSLLFARKDIRYAFANIHPHTWWENDYRKALFKYVFRYALSLKNGQKYTVNGRIVREYVDKKLDKTSASA